MDTLIRETLEKIIAGFLIAGEPVLYTCDRPSPFAERLYQRCETGYNQSRSLTPGTYAFTLFTCVQVCHVPAGVNVNINAVNGYKKSIPLYCSCYRCWFPAIIHNLHMKRITPLLAGNTKHLWMQLMKQKAYIPDYLQYQRHSGNYVPGIFIQRLYWWCMFVLAKWAES